MGSDANPPKIKTTVEEQFDPEILRAIGALIVTAGLAEQSLMLQVLRLLGHPNGIHVSGLPAIAGMEFRTKLAVLRALAAMHVPKHSKEISNCCDEMQDAIDKRHTLAHSHIAKGRSKLEISIQKLKVGKDGKLPKVFYWKAHGIREFTNRIGDSSIDLDRCLTQAGIQPLTTPKAPKP
jgi:hypothetical protein